MKHGTRLKLKVQKDALSVCSSCLQVDHSGVASTQYGHMFRVRVDQMLTPSLDMYPFWHFAHVLQ